MKEFVMAHPYLTTFICVTAICSIEEIVRKICVTFIFKKEMDSIHGKKS